MPPGGHQRARTFDREGWAYYSASSLTQEEHAGVGDQRNADVDPLGLAARDSLVHVAAKWAGGIEWMRSKQMGWQAALGSKQRCPFVHVPRKERAAEQVREGSVDELSNTKKSAPSQSLRPPQTKNAISLASYSLADLHVAAGAQRQHIDQLLHGRHLLFVSLLNGTLEIGGVPAQG